MRSGGSLSTESIRHSCGSRLEGPEATLGASLFVGACGICCAAFFAGGFTCSTFFITSSNGSGCAGLASRSLLLSGEHVLIFLTNSCYDDPHTGFRAEVANPDITPNVGVISERAVTRSQSPRIGRYVIWPSVPKLILAVCCQPAR